MSDHCGSTTEDGNAVCIPGECACSSGPNNNQPVILSLPRTNDKRPLLDQTAIKSKKAIAVDHLLEKSNVAENS